MLYEPLSLIVEDIINLNNPKGQLFRLSKKSIKELIFKYIKDKFNNTGKAIEVLDNNFLNYVNTQFLRINLANIDQINYLEISEICWELIIAGKLKVEKCLVRPLNYHKDISDLDVSPVQIVIYDWIRKNINSVNIVDIINLRKINKILIKEGYQVSLKEIYNAILYLAADKLLKPSSLKVIPELRMPKPIWYEDGNIRIKSLVFNTK